MTTSRRRVLAGLGASLALPSLEAFAQGTPPRRFVTLFSPNGTVTSDWEPTRTGTTWTLSPILQPLMDDPAVEEIICNGPMRLFVKRPLLERVRATLRLSGEGSSRPRQGFARPPEKIKAATGARR